MKEIELIEKYARQRQKYRKWDFYAKDTDIQRLGRVETGCWSLIFYFGFNLQWFVLDIFSDRLFPKLASFGVLTFCGYLVFELNRTRKLRALFERTALQNAVDLIEIIKKAPNQASDATSELAPIAGSSSHQG